MSLSAGMKIALTSTLRRIAQEQLDMLLAYEALTVNTLDHVEALSAMRDGRRAQFGRE
jgi:enoyl-CoA hydratase